MHRQRIAFGLSIALLCWLHLPLRAQDLRHLEGAKELRIARFHSIWFFTGFSPAVCGQTRNQLVNLANAFSNEFVTIVRGTPTGLRVIPEPTTKIDPENKETRLNRTEVLSRLDEFQKRVIAAKCKEGEDVIFCYMMCHGKVVDGKPFLNFGKGDDFPRSDIVKRLKTIQTDTEARLVVLFIDACAEVDRATKMLSEVSAVPDPPAAVWRALYFGHEGFVGLAASRAPGEYGFLGKTGTVFMEAFTSAFDLRLKAETKAIRDGKGPRRERILEASNKFTELLKHGKKDGILSWDEFLPHLQEQVDIAYKAKVEQLKKEADPELQDILKKMTDQKGQHVELFEKPRLLTSKRKE